MITDTISPVHKPADKIIISDEKLLNNIKSNNVQTVARDSYDNDPEIEALDPLSKWVQRFEPHEPCMSIDQPLSEFQFNRRMCCKSFEFFFF